MKIDYHITVQWLTEFNVIRSFVAIIINLFFTRIFIPPAYISSDEKKTFQKVLEKVKNGATKTFLDAAQKYNSNFIHYDFPGKTILNYLKTLFKNSLVTLIYI